MTSELPTFGVAMRRLRAAQKSSRGAPAYSRFINRPLGRPMAAAAFVRGLTPTQVTLLSGLATASGIVCIALFTPGLSAALVITLLLVVGYALDSADGQVARLMGRSTLAGEWLDHFFDALKASTLHIAVFVSWSRHPDSNQLLAAPLAFTVISAVFFFGVTSADLLRRIGQSQGLEAAAPSGHDRRNSPVYSMLVLPADYGVLCLTFLLFGWGSAFAVVYTGLAIVNGVLLILSGFRWYRSIRRIDALSGTESVS